MKRQIPQQSPLLVRNNNDSPQHAQQQQQPRKAAAPRQKQSFLALKLYGLVVFCFWSPSFLQAASKAMLSSSPSPEIVAMGYNSLTGAADEHDVAEAAAVAPAPGAAALISTAANKTLNATIAGTYGDADKNAEMPTIKRVSKNNKDITTEYYYSRYTKQTEELPAHGNVLLYLTTHLSDAHINFLEHCWPTLMERSSLLRNAHVLVYTNPCSEKSQMVQKALDLMQNNLFRNNPSLRIFITNTTTSQEYGPLDSMWQGSKRQWWWSGSQLAALQGGDDDPGYAYDWIVRLHPDVLLRNETFFIETMKDPTVEGIFADCYDFHCPKNECRRRRIHTDITVFRPGSLREKRAFFVPKKRREFAVPEEVAGRAFQDVIGKGADRWIPNTGLHHRICRVGHEQVMDKTVVGPKSPVVHTHDILPKSAEQCLHLEQPHLQKKGFAKVNIGYTTTVSTSTSLSFLEEQVGSAAAFAGNLTTVNQTEEAVPSAKTKASVTKKSKGSSIMNQSSEFYYSRYTGRSSPLPPQGNVLLYLTSRLSKEHLSFLQHCWPAVLERSSILRNAHVLVYANPSNLESETTKKALTLMQETLFVNNPSLRIYTTSTTTSQEYGPLDAMMQGTKRKWWWSGSQYAASAGPNDDPAHAYDWIVRLHPDVLVRNETFFLDAMANLAVEGIFAECLSRANSRIHTDITVFRPGSLRQKLAFFVPKKRLAVAVPEEVAARAFQDIVAHGGERWIPGTSSHLRVCRIGYAQSNDGTQSPVIHNHDIVPTSSAQCIRRLL